MCITTIIIICMFPYSLAVRHSVVIEKWTFDHYVHNDLMCAVHMETRQAVTSLHKCWVLIQKNRRVPHPALTRSWTLGTEFTVQHIIPPAARPHVPQRPSLVYQDFENESTVQVECFRNQHCLTLQLTELIVTECREGGGHLHFRNNLGIQKRKAAMNND